MKAKTQTIHEPAPPPDKTEAFLNKTLGDLAGFTNITAAYLGDKLGLYRVLTRTGPTDSRMLARETGLSERYLREWLAWSQAAGHLEYAPETGLYMLPPEHAPILADERGPMFFGGGFEIFVEGIQSIHKVREAFRTGEGVQMEAYNDGVFEGMLRFSAPWYENLLVQQWLPRVPDAVQRLQEGIDAADVGCGRGLALLKLAEAFPNSRFVGYDLYPPNVTHARQAAKEAGLSDRVHFEVLDASHGIPGPHDLITTFDVVHDSAEPQALVTSIREALRPGGLYLNVDINCHDQVEKNEGPLGAVFYGISMFYCMSVSLGQGGAGLGTCGLTPRLMREFGESGGFRACEQVDLEDPFNNLYVLRV